MVLSEAIKAYDRGKNIYVALLAVEHVLHYDYNYRIVIINIVAVVD